MNAVTQLLAMGRESRPEGASDDLRAFAETLDLNRPVFADGSVLPPLRRGEIRPLPFDLRGSRAAVIEAQAQAFDAGAGLFLVGVAPGLVQFGPVVRPDFSGCASCWERRSRNNQRGPAASSGIAARSAGLQQPLTAAAEQMLRLLASHYLDGVAAGDDSLFRNGYARVRTDTLEVSCHRFQEVTGCRHCRRTPRSVAAPLPLHFQSRPKLNAEDKRAPNPLLSLASARRAFVDRFSGIVKHVFQDTSSGLMPLCSAEMQLLDQDSFEAGYGRAESAQKSELIAILEAAERYAGHEPQGGQESIRASYRDLRERHEAAVDPRCFILHDEAVASDPAFALRAYSDDLPIGWSRGHSMRTSSATLVPEQLVYYQLRNRHGPVNRFVFDSSNGCSLGGGIEEAILGGLYEVVERDAYFATWYARITPPRILNQSITDARSAALVARAEAEGFEIHLFDIRTDIAIPTVWGMIVDPAADAPVKSYCASACHGRWDDAIFSALVEITTSMGVYRRSMPAGRERARSLLSDHALVREMPDHVLLYSLPESYERLDFLHGGATVSLAECEADLPSLAFDDVKDELECQVAKVLGAAEDVIVVDQSFAQLSDLGLACVKVLIPGLLPVTFGHQYRRIGLDRINAVCRTRGTADGHDASTINPNPHNFP